MWHPQQFVTHPGVGTPRDYVHDYSEAVQATLEPLRYILQGQAQNQTAQHENEQDRIAQLNSQSTAKRADAYLALEQARSEHYNQSDSARLALEQAQEARAKIQAQAEAETFPLKVALTRAQIAQFQLENQAKTDALNNQAADNATLSKFSQQLHSMSDDDILNGKAQDLLGDTNFNTSEAIKRADSMLEERQDRGANGYMLKAKSAWNLDERNAFYKAQVPKEQGGLGLSTGDAFSYANGLAQKRNNPATQKQEEEQNKQNIDENGMGAWRAWAMNHNGQNPRDLNAYTDDPQKAAVSEAEKLAQAGYALTKDDPSKTAYYRLNPDQIYPDAQKAGILKPTANNPTTPVAPTERFYKNVTPAPAPNTNTPLNPGAIQDPSQQPNLINPTIGTQTIVPGMTQGTTPGTSQIDDQTLNSLGAIHEWRTNQLSAMSGGGDNSGQQLASLENAQGENA
jgi:hypothetical protein